MADDEVRESPPVADEAPGPAEQPNHQPERPVELTEVKRGVDFLTTTIAPVDQFRPELDAPSVESPPASTSDQGVTQAGPVDGSGDQSE